MWWRLPFLPGDPPPNPQVDVIPHTPSDIAFQDGRPVIEHLRATTKFVLMGVLIPAAEMFPGLTGTNL